MNLERVQARASLTVRHERPYDYDESKGIWLYRRLDDDEQYHNLITTAGRTAIHTFIYGTAAQRTAASLGSGFHFIGLSNDATAPSASDTSLTGELSTSGLGRAEGAVVLPTTGAITTVSYQFTYTGGGSQGIQKTALFDVISAGNMAHEILFTQRVLATNDTVTMTFSITVT